jgi:hypothetical protein
MDGDQVKIFYDWKCSLSPALQQVELTVLVSALLQYQDQFRAKAPMMSLIWSSLYIEICQGKMVTSNQ